MTCLNNWIRGVFWRICIIKRPSIWCFCIKCEGAIYKRYTVGMQVWISWLDKAVFVCDYVHTHTPCINLHPHTHTHTNTMGGILFKSKQWWMFMQPLRGLRTMFWDHYVCWCRVLLSFCSLNCYDRHFRLEQPPISLWLLMPSLDLRVAEAGMVGLPFRLLVSPI